MSRTSVSNFYVNGDVLRSFFVEKGLSLTEASDAIGRSHSYLSHKLSDGVLNVSDAILLESMFGIKRCEYEVNNSVCEEAEDEETVEEVVGIDYDKLYQTIYSAVVAGVTKALEG